MEHKSVPMIKELSFIAYYVRDVPRASKFYGEVLGLKPGQWFNDDGLIDLGNATFALDGTAKNSGTPGTSLEPRSKLTIFTRCGSAWSTPELELRMYTSFAPCWTCFAHDPEGNRSRTTSTKKRRRAAASRLDGIAVS